MAKERIVNALWDAEAGVWVATSEDIAGLVTESKTFEALLKKLRTLVPELMSLNRQMPTNKFRVIPANAGMTRLSAGNR